MLDEVERPLDVLLDQQERDALAGQAAQHGHHLIHQDRRDAEERLVEQIGVGGDP